MIRISTLCLICLILLFSCQQALQAAQKQLYFPSDSITAELNKLHEMGQINGFATAIVHSSGTLYANGIGYADVASQTPYGPQTIQNIGSVSKTFIGIALLKAQEMGKLKLDDAINSYLPFEVKNPNHPEDVITLRHLATHTSSILDTDFYDEKAYILKDSVENPEELAKINESFTPPASRISMMDFLKNVLSPEGEWYLKESFSSHKSGAIYEYTNVGATLAAAVLEEATGENHEAFVTKHILKPLGMESSGLSFNQIDLSQHSKLYASPETELPFYSLITYPDGGMITSISDLSIYLAELIKGYAGEGSLLEKESYQELFREQLSAKNLPDRDKEDDYDDEYNTGIFMGFTPRGYVGHTGGDPGIATFMFFDPKTQMGRILMINTSIRNSEGVQQFYAIWNKLGDYEKKYQQP